MPAKGKGSPMNIAQPATAAVKVALTAQNAARAKAQAMKRVNASCATAQGKSNAADYMAKPV